MDELLHKLAAHRRRIRSIRAADAALRGAFYASVAACLVLLVSKFAGLPLPAAVAGGLLAAVPVVMAIREWVRAFSIRDCAIHLDRLLGLDERLSTAIEAPGVMGGVLLADAGVALARAPLPDRRFPREGRLLGGSAALLGMLLVIPAPGRGGAKGDAELEAVTDEVVASLEGMAKVEVEFKELTEEAGKKLREGRSEEALALLEELRRKIAEKMLESPGGRGAELEKLLDQATSGAAAISAQLARLERTVHAPPAAVARAKLARQKLTEQNSAPGPEDESPGTAKAAASGAAAWSPRYDPVIRRYFGREP